jgi:pimeloyl-ACP methyl ester carboxylesterase
MSYPVMMVHGMCCTGEVWHNFRRYFEEREAAVFTPTLRPEQRVRKNVPESLSEVSLADYVQDLEAELDRIEAETGKRPVLIGHSMGGLLAQLLAERNLVPAAVFISPTAPVGARDLATRMLWTSLRFWGALGMTPGIIRPGGRLLDRTVLNVAGFVAESGRAFLDFATCGVDESRIRIPTLTVSAVQDKLVPARLTRLTGEKYARAGGEFLEYESHGHWIYDEPGWEKPAADIHGWLGRHAGS